MLFAMFLSPGLHQKYGTRTYFHFDFRRMKELFRIGLPVGLAMFLDIFNWSIFTGFIIGRFGDVSLAAHNIAISFMHLCFMPAVAVSIGVSAIVGQWLGRRQIQVAKQRVHVSLFLCMGYMVTMGFLLAVFGERLIYHIFSKDTEVVQLGHRLLILAALFQVFDAMNITCSGALRGAGDTHWVMWAMVITAYCFFLPLAVVMGIVLGWGALGAWVSATLYTIVLGLVLIGRFLSERWTKIIIFSDSEITAE